MSTLSAHVIDLAAYYRTHEGLEGTELENRIARLRSLHPFAVGIELTFGDHVVGAWAETEPFHGVVPQDVLSVAQSPADLPDGSIEKAIDKSVADKLGSLLFPAPYSVS